MSYKGRTVSEIYAGTLTEFGSIANDAIERLVNPAPYYNLSMCRRSLTVVQLAIAAVEGGYRPVECFNHAVDGGIVFG